MKPSLSRTVFGVVLACLLALIALPFTVLSVSAAVHSNEPDIASIDAYVSAQTQANSIPGVALGLVHNDQIVHLRGFGSADQSGRAVTPQTPFILGSVSKSFTALAIMQLVEAGKVELDAPVQRYLPWFRVADTRASTQITVRQLLNQTSGLPPSAGLLQPTVVPLTLEQYVRGLQTVSLTAPVGTTFQYSNANYSTLGLLIQVISGEAYGVYIQQHIFAPLQMQHSFASEQEANRNGLAQGYTWQFGTRSPTQNYDLQPALLPAGGLISTAEDLSHYLLAQMNGGRYGTTQLLSPTGIATLHAAAIDTQGFQEPHTSYGMGWFNGSIDGIPAIYHDGDTATFHAYLLIEPQQQWSAVILTNIWGVAGALLTFPHLQVGLAHLLSGQQPPATGLTVPTFYLLVDAILLLLSGLILWPLLRLPRWYRQSVSNRKQRRWLARTILRLVWEIALPVTLFLTLPILSGFSWTVLVRLDFTLWLLVSLALLLMTGVIRITLAVLFQPGKGQQR